MGLQITSLELKNFRSYEHFLLEDIGELTIFVGANAAGKTNIIEAIQLITALNSFRSSKATELVRQIRESAPPPALMDEAHPASSEAAEGTEGAEAEESKECKESTGNEESTGVNESEGADKGTDKENKAAPQPPMAKVRGVATDGNRHLDLEMIIEGNRRRYLLNGKPKHTKDIRGTLPAITFTPDDLELIKGSNRFRRREIDQLGMQVNSNYGQILRDYEKVYKHKMQLLKDENHPLSPAMLGSLNVVFAKVATQLTNYRRSLFERMMPKVQAYYDQITEGREMVEGVYRIEGGPLPSLEEFERILDEIMHQEIERQRCLRGPHLDKIELFIDGMDASTFASQGQQRSVVLALKLAEAEIVEELLDQHPVLLLDDVMSELDGTRRQALVKQLLQDKQTFITTANIQYFDEEMLSCANIVEL